MIEDADAGSLLAHSCAEKTVFRVTLFSIVLTLATPQASLLCKLWCPPSDAVTGECQHHDQVPSASVKAGDSCGVIELSVLSFIREEGPRGASSSAALHALPMPRQGFDQPANGPRILDSGCTWAFEARPLETTLRL